MKRALILSAGLVTVVVLTAVPTHEGIEAPAASYVGAARCKVCHLEIFKSWQKTKHAHALTSLKGEDASSLNCLSCHTTGFGKDGYGTEGGLIDLGNVQCEACHGAGSHYSKSSIMRQSKLSRQFGLVEIDSTVCVTCHNSKSPTFKGFAYKAGLLTGTHSRRRKPNR
jgi:hypothetical protein